MYYISNTLANPVAFTLRFSVRPGCKGIQTTVYCEYFKGFSIDWYSFCHLAILRDPSRTWFDNDMQSSNECLLRVGCAPAVPHLFPSPILRIETYVKAISLLNRFFTYLHGVQHLFFNWFCFFLSRWVYLLLSTVFYFANYVFLFVIKVCVFNWRSCQRLRIVLMDSHLFLLYWSLFFVSKILLSKRFWRLCGSCYLCF